MHVMHKVVEQQWSGLFFSLSPEFIVMMVLWWPQSSKKHLLGPSYKFLINFIYDSACFVWCASKSEVILNQTCLCNVIYRYKPTFFLGRVNIKFNVPKIYVA